MPTCSHKSYVPKTLVICVNIRTRLPRSFRRFNNLSTIDSFPQFSTKCSPNGSNFLSSTPSNRYGCPQHFLSWKEFGNIKRINFDSYIITTAKKGKFSIMMRMTIQKEQRDKINVIHLRTCITIFNTAA